MPDPDNLSLIRACQEKEKIKTGQSTSSCYANVCALLMQAMQVAKVRDAYAEVDDRAYVTEATRTLDLSGKLVKMVGGCDEVPIAVAVSYVSGHKAQSDEWHAECQRVAALDADHDCKVKDIFGPYLSQLFLTRNVQTKRFCAQVAKTAEDCEVADAAINSRLSPNN